MVTNQIDSRTSLLERWLVRYTNWAALQPWRVLGAALLLLTVCWALASQLRIKGDFVSLLPSESGTAKRFRAATRTTERAGFVSGVTSAAAPARRQPDFR